MHFRKEKTMNARYRYEPGLLDRFNPNVVAGRPIVAGAAVAITGEVTDPMHKFVYVQDESGNRQSVYRSALVLIRERVPA
jgi:hypothetical protein